MLSAGLGQQWQTRQRRLVAYEHSWRANVEILVVLVDALARREPHRQALAICRPRLIVLPADVELVLLLDVLLVLYELFEIRREGRPAFERIFGPDVRDTRLRYGHKLRSHRVPHDVDHALLRPLKHLRLLLAVHGPNVDVVLRFDGRCSGHVLAPLAKAHGPPLQAVNYILKLAQAVLRQLHLWRTHRRRRRPTANAAVGVDDVGFLVLLNQRRPGLRNSLRPADRRAGRPTGSRPTGGPFGGAALGACHERIDGHRPDDLVRRVHKERLAIVGDAQPLHSALEARHARARNDGAARGVYRQQRPPLHVRIQGLAARREHCVEGDRLLAGGGGFGRTTKREGRESRRRVGARAGLPRCRRAFCIAYEPRARRAWTFRDTSHRLGCAGRTRLHLARCCVAQPQRAVLRATRHAETIRGES
mmetsp:Transcript_8119/g.32902  ORF Transcript_8119/g.32902 Transcript_8119/m.32902 type:complete len:420 (+) Transcript_8119:2366-3625(+)